MEKQISSDQSLRFWKPMGQVNVVSFFLRFDGPGVGRACSMSSWMCGTFDHKMLNYAIKSHWLLRGSSRKPSQTFFAIPLELQWRCSLRWKNLKQRDHRKEEHWELRLLYLKGGYCGIERHVCSWKSNIMAKLWGWDIEDAGLGSWQDREVMTRTAEDRLCEKKEATEKR